MDEGEDRGQRRQFDLRIALAVSVLRAKPPQLTTSEHCELLRQKAIERALRWREDNAALAEERVKLKERIVGQQLPASDSAGSWPTLDGGNSVFLTPSSSLDKPSQLALAAGPRVSLYEAVLDACMTCNSSWTSSEACSSVLSNSWPVLLDSLQHLVVPAPLFGRCHTSVLADMVVRTLVSIDHLLPAGSEDFFKHWIATFVLEEDGSAAFSQRGRGHRSASLLRRLASGHRLRASIGEAAAWHLSRLTVDDLADPGLTSVRFDVLAWERAAILVLLLEVTSGHHGADWQRMLGHCLTLPFPLLVRRICALTCRLTSL